MDKDTCWACGDPLLNNNREMHHVRPKVAGGEGGIVVPLCTTCHNMVDRTPLDKWPMDWIAVAAESVPRETRLLMLKVVSFAYWLAREQGDTP
jgi:hypothetical protein